MYTADGSSESKLLYPPATDRIVESVAISISTTIPRLLSISMCFGLMICVLVFATGSISGGNLNPAVTLSLLVAGKMSLLRAIAYIAAQCSGAVAGAAFARSLSPDLFDAVGGGANGIAPAIFNEWGGSLWAPLMGEMVGTGLLVFTVSAAADAGRERANKYVGALTPLMIGFSVMCAHVFLVPIDGCSINPARSLGSAVIAQKWETHWLFWVGPLAGGTIVGFVYDRIFYTGVNDGTAAAATQSLSLAAAGAGAGATPGMPGGPGGPGITLGVTAAFAAGSGGGMGGGGGGAGKAGGGAPHL